MYVKIRHRDSFKCLFTYLLTTLLNLLSVPHMTTLFSVSPEPPVTIRLLRLSAVALDFLSVRLSHSYPSDTLNFPL